MRTNKADLLLLDMIMEPGIDGLEAYRRILQINPDQKAAITSGFSESERVHTARRLGAQVYVKKPYGVETLAQAVLEALR
jgi:DNA-binding NarL/FixJ family response regulator